MKKVLPWIFLLFSIILIIALGITAFFIENGGVMRSKYLLKEVSSEGNGLAIQEGDVILDKNFQFEVLPASMDSEKPITRTKISNSPSKPSERLIRIKELSNDSAVVAVLYQESYFEGEDTLVTTETEKLIYVKYGEEFTVSAKQQAYDSGYLTFYTFIIADGSKPQEQNVQNYCTECGAKLIKGDKFCRECGTPVPQQ